MRVPRREVEQIAALGKTIPDFEPGDTVLVKGSRSVGLERVGEILVNATKKYGEVDA